jgi:branched-subunit amino acid ABC-type transport system permease component
VIIVGAILAMLVCHILLTFTNFGKSLRAVSDNRELANISGINATRITQLTWAFGGALTGVAGFSLGITVGSLSPTFGFSFLFIVLSAAVVGGLGRPYGAMLGAIVVGLATQVSGLYITSAYTPAIAFGVLILVLLLRPDGILGRAVVTA